MPFSSLTKQKLKQLAGSTIYNRGQGYFESGAVTKIWLEDDKLLAKVLGSQGDYEVEIEEDSGLLWCCSCPYDGYICKHVVAAGLEFLDKKDKIVKDAKQTVSRDIDLKEKLFELNEQDLVELLILSLKTHTSWKNVFLKKVAEKLDQIGLSDETQTIYEQEFLSHFDRACKIMEDFNQYGGGPDEDYNEAYEELEQITELFQENKLNQKLKKEFFDKMFYYYDWDNSGMNDIIINAVYEVADRDEDWHYIIEKLKAKKQDSSYRQGMIIDIYKDKLKNEEKYLKLRESKLEGGWDYYDLANFWDKKGEKEKAVEIAKQGIQKCDNGLIDLWEYLFKYYQKKDYDQALNYLKQIYQEHSGLENYRRLKKFVKKENWPEVDKWCKQLLTDEDSLYQLAKIHEFNQEDNKVLAYVLVVPKNKWEDWDYDNKDEFANKLTAKYPKELIPYYERKVIRHIENKTRKSYQIAVDYAKKLKQIYSKYLDKKEEWQKYIDDIRRQYSNCPALIDEFKGL